MDITVWSSSGQPRGTSGAWLVSDAAGADLRSLRGLELNPDFDVGLSNTEREELKQAITGRVLESTEN